MLPPVSARDAQGEIGIPFSFASRDASRVSDPGRLRVRGALALRAMVDGDAVPRELSGLAWSEDDGLLYAVTDAGRLLHLKPRIVAGELVGVTLVASRRLADTQGHPLTRRDADAEGLAARDAADGQAGNTRLLVSFEGRPVIAEHTADGRRLRRFALTPPLDDAAHYDGPNHGLEALAWTATHGYVVALEKPQRGRPRDVITLYAENGAHWDYPVEDAMSQSITGLDTLPDGRLLAVERRYAGPWRPVVCTLSRLRIDGQALGIEMLASYSSALGWPVDNFEAIAVHRDGHFFVASDDNENPLQQALLIYFELPDADGRP